MKAYSATFTLADGRVFSVRYLLDAEELAGLQAVGLIPHDACQVVGMQEAADNLIAHIEAQSYKAFGGVLQ